MNIGTNALTVNPASLPNGSRACLQSDRTASGGTGPYSFAVTSGALPAGLSLNASSGAITGTPSGSGASAFTIKATDSNGNVGSRGYNVNIGTSILSVNPASLPPASQGSAYNQTVSASGGTGPYVLVLISGSLPAGLSFNAGSGAITGTPTGSGLSTFAIQATDANGNIGSRSYALNVGSNSLTINPATLPAAPHGRAYSQALTGSGGTGPYVFSLQSGALPPGLSLTGGVITGMPTTEGSYSFTLFVRDANGNFGTRAYVLSTLRANPANDPDVQGLVAAQAASARRFTDTQTSNVLRHLEGLHDNFNPCGLNFGINASTYNLPQPYPDPTIPSASINKDPYPPLAQQPPQVAALPGCTTLSAPPVAIWASGAVKFGRMTSAGLTDSNKFTTSGVTAGIEAHVADPLIIGGAVGFGLDHTDIGLKGTLSDADNLNGCFYTLATRRRSSSSSMRWSAMARCHYDNTRWVTLDNTTVSGSRNGSTWFGSINVNYEIKRGAFKFSPYVGINAMTARLNQYSEAGDANQALTYLARPTYPPPPAWSACAVRSISPTAVTSTPQTCGLNTSALSMAASPSRCSITRPAAANSMPSTRAVPRRTSSLPPLACGPGSGRARRSKSNMASVAPRRALPPGSADHTRHGAMEFRGELTPASGKKCGKGPDPA